MTGGAPKPLAALSPPADEDDLDERLTRPTAGVIDTLRRATGDILVLGAGGKIGASLAGMLRRALDDAGSDARVIAISRFGDVESAKRLEKARVEIVRADLAERKTLESLPDAPNVFFLAGQKFGTSGAPASTWGTNVVIPAMIAERFAGARLVAFSTGNVYPLVPVSDGGSREGDEPGPVGEYAMSCLARERVLEYAALRYGIAVSLIRLNYAVDLRYGVLVDLARRIFAGEPIDLGMGHVNVIWQGDACAWAIQSLGVAATPAFVLNVTGPETLEVREVAIRLGQLLGKDPVFSGEPAADALLSNAGLARELFGPPTVSADVLIEWAASWTKRGGRTLGRPTHFEARDGRY